MDFELNKPLTYLNKFQELIRDSGWAVDLFWARDYTNKVKPSVDDKIAKAEFLIIRKPLTFLSSAMIRKKLQDLVFKKTKNMLVMYTFSETDSLIVMNQFLQPFKINASEIKVIDHKTNLKDKRDVIFQKKNDCFSHDEIFTGINKILIPHPHYIYVDTPAKVLIRGNPTTEIDQDNDIEVESGNLSGSDIVVGAYYEEAGRILVLDSTLFLDKYFDHNKKFIKNVITWLGGDSKKA
jgi:hypothetical protein